MVCPHCSKEIPDNTVFCGNCGKPTRPIKDDSSGIQKIIPYKNIPALIGYYFGVFSILPCFPIGIIGFVLGIMGLIHAKKHPESRGKIHAWIGIILGGIFGLLYLFLTFFFFFVSKM